MCRDRLPEFRKQAGLSVSISVEFEDGDLAKSDRLEVDHTELLNLLDPIGNLYTDLKVMQLFFRFIQIFALFLFHEFY